MKRLLSIATTIAAVVALTAGPAAAAHDRGDLTIGLNGANEIGTDGDQNASGKIHLDFFDAVDNPAVVFPGQHYVCYQLTTRNLDSATIGLHIHRVAGTTANPRLDNGGVAVNLMADTRPSGDSTCVAVAGDVFDGIQANPSDYYVNLHTVTHPAGAIRGQLHSFN